jgi:hypothetical protein
MKFSDMLQKHTDRLTEIDLQNEEARKRRAEEKASRLETLRRQYRDKLRILDAISDWLYFSLQIPED